MNSEELDNIRHVNQVLRAEVDRVATELSEFLDSLALPEETKGRIIDRLSREIGQVSAKVSLLEQAARAFDVHNRGASRTELVSAVGATSPSPTIEFPIALYQGNKNLLPLEHTATHIAYNWTADDPQTEFGFVLDRSRKMEMKIHILALIKPEYSRKMKIIVDGNHIKHKFFKSGDAYIARSILPVSEGSERTMVRMVLPGTFSPEALGGGEDGRKIGVALIKFGFSHTEESLFGFFKGNR